MENKTSTLDFKILHKVLRWEWIESLTGSINWISGSWGFQNWAKFSRTNKSGSVTLSLWCGTDFLYFGHLQITKMNHSDIESAAGYLEWWWFVLVGPFWYQRPWKGPVLYFLLPRRQKRKQLQMLNDVFNFTDKRCNLVQSVGFFSPISMHQRKALSLCTYTSK